MNTNGSDDRVSQQDLDRLVEGELSQADRRRVITALETADDGWERCATAFLEAQSWRKACRSMVTEPADNDAAQRVPAPKRRRLIVGFSASLAAAVLVSLTLGVVLGRSWFSADSPLAGADLPVGQAKNDGRTNPSPKSPSAGDRGKVRLVGLVKYQGEDGNERAVPVISGAGLDDQWLANQPPAISEYERSELERRGWKVEQHRKVITVQLAGGRVSIPVDLFRARFIGNRVY